METTRRESVNAVRELAIRSGQMISMDPERWGDSHLDQLENELNNFLSQVPEEMKEELEKAYISRYSEWLNTLSRCFSVMITGGSNFNNKRHLQRNAAEMAARTRLDEWAERTIKRVNRKKRLTGWAEVERLQQKLEKLQQLQEQMKTANKIVRSTKLTDEEKIDELVSQLGVSEATAREINAEPAYSFQVKGFAPYHLSNNLAKIKATEEAIQRHSQLAEAEDTETEYKWGRVTFCNSDERVRIYFNEIPDADTRNVIKHRGFKWSPSNQAWQRQITPAARHATQFLVDYLNEKMAN